MRREGLFFSLLSVQILPECLLGVKPGITGQVRDRGQCNGRTQVSVTSKPTIVQAPAPTRTHTVAAVPSESPSEWLSVTHRTLTPGLFVHKRAALAKPFFFNEAG